MAEKKVHFGLAPKTIIGIVLIALIISAVSVLMGSNIYWNDIVEHYGNVARHTAKAVENIFDKDELAAWEMLLTDTHTGMPPTRKLPRSSKAIVIRSSSVLPRI